MQVEDAVSLVGRLRYKPGWNVTASHEPNADVLVLNVGRMEPDTEKRDPDVPEIPIMYTASVPVPTLEARDEDDFLQWVYDVIAARELHEVEEWLRLDDKPLREPHPEKGWTRSVLGPGHSMTLPTMESL